MSDEQKTTQEESRTPCGDMPFAAMIEKMMGQQGQGCGCMAPGVMSQMMGQPGMDCDCSEMMAMCGGRAQDEEEITTAEAARKV